MKRIITITILVTLICVSCKSKSNIQASSKATSKATVEMAANRLTLQDSLINFGKNYLRTPYRYGGNTPRGFDCSGFTSHVYRNFGYDLDRSSRDQAKQFPTIKKNDLQTGDLVFFEGRSHNGNVGHVGIVTQTKPNGEFDFIHASVQRGVTISSSNEAYYASRYLRAGRVITNTSTTFTRAATAAPSKEKSPSFGNSVSSSAPTAKNITDAVYHTVAKGDNISSISKKYDVPISTIQHLNNLSSKRVKRGQRLLITEAVNIPEMPIAKVTYVDGNTSATSTVVNNLKVNTNTADNKRTNTASIEKEQKNKIEQPVSNYSEQLKPQEKAQVVVVSSGQPTSPQGNALTHKVKAGESLFAISKRYNLTVEELKSLNNLTSGSINAGQILVVGSSNQAPTPATVAVEKPQAAESVVHTVKKGDTLYSIARQYNCSVSDLRKWNAHLTDAIKIGEKVRVTP